VARARSEDEVGIVDPLGHGEDAEVNLSYPDGVPEEDQGGSPKLI